MAPLREMNMLRARWIGLVLGVLGAGPLSAPGQNQLPPRPPKVPGLAPVPHRQANPAGNPPANNNNNNGGLNFNLNNGGVNNLNNAGLNGFNLGNPITGGNGGPPFASSPLNSLYSAASPFGNPFSNPFLTPFNNPFPIVNNPFTYGNLRNLYTPYAFNPYNFNPYLSNPFTYPMNNVYTVNPFASSYYNSAFLNPYTNPYGNPFLPPTMPDNPLANPFLPALFYQNLLQNPTPFNQLNQ